MALDLRPGHKWLREGIQDGPGAGAWAQGAEGGETGWPWSWHLGTGG